jgi:hypothetical protein
VVAVEDGSAEIKISHEYGDFSGRVERSRSEAMEDAADSLERLA